MINFFVQSNMKLSRKPYLAFIAVLIFFPGLISGCGSSTEETATEPVKPVKYQAIHYTSQDEIRTFPGSARSDREIGLSFRTSGILTLLNINLGQKVAKDELLAQLDNAETILSLEQAVASKNSAESTLHTATSTLERTRTLFEKGSASLSDYENAKSSFASAKANYESALRSVDIREKQVSYGMIYAPANGIIASKLVEINENVSAGQVIAVLDAGIKMEVSLGIPENLINRVTYNMPAQITFTALKGKQYKGIVSEISPAVDVNTATYPVRVQIHEPGPEIRPGMAANVTFSFPKKQNQKSLIVPVSAVGEDSGGNFVFLIQPDDGAGSETGDEAAGTVKKHHFNVGKLTPSGFTVKDGLKAGDMVATAGLQTLLDGQKVKLQQ